MAPTEYKQLTRLEREEFWEVLKEIKRTRDK